MHDTQDVPDRCRAEDNLRSDELLVLGMRGYVHELSFVYQPFAMLAGFLATASSSLSAPRS